PISRCNGRTGCTAAARRSAPAETAAGRHALLYGRAVPRGSGYHAGDAGWNGENVAPSRARHAERCRSQCESERMSTDSELDKHLHALFGGLDTGTDFEARLMAHLRTESQADAAERVLR